MLETLQREHGGDADTRIVEELGVAEGGGRIDVAVVNGTLTGFELKSARDDLHRLPRQTVLFGAVFDELTLVVAEKHLAKASDLIPSHWGLVLAEGSVAQSSLKWLRHPSVNPHVSAVSVAQLLWREEALALLEERDCAKGVRNKPRGFIWERLVEVLTLDELRAAVRNCLKNRKDWRSGA